MKKYIYIFVGSDFNKKEFEKNGDTDGVIYFTDTDNKKGAIADFKEYIKQFDKDYHWDDFKMVLVKESE